jgi:phage gpG-like protein
MYITFEVAGDEQLKRSFSRFGEHAKDLSEPFREIVKDFYKIEKKQFESEGGYGSGGWQPLSPRYAAWKAKKYPGRPLMVVSGLLKESLLGENPYSIENVTPKSMEVGTVVNFAVYHQKGTCKMPARPLIQLTDADKKRWIKFIQVYLVKQARAEFQGVCQVQSEGFSHIKNI